MAGFPRPPLPGMPMVPMGMAPPTGMWRPPVPAAVPPAPPSGGWKEAKSADGRPYYFNTLTQETVWEKPRALKTKAELLREESPWRELTDPSTSKTYFHNRVTNATVWTKPQELEDLDRAIAFQEARERDPKSKAFLYETKEEARQAFQRLLLEKGVRSDWPWDKVKRTISSDPRYEALNRENEKAKCFNNWKVIRAKEEKEEARLKLQAQKDALRTAMLERDEISPSSTWAEASDLFETHPAWMAVENERDRRDVVEDVIRRKQRAARDAERAKHEELMAMLTAVWRKMEGLQVLTRWTEARDWLLQQTEFTEDERIRNCDMLDILQSFQRVIAEQEEAFREYKHKQRELERRKIRKFRDDFKALLDELEQEGILHAKSFWRDLYPTIAKDHRYMQLLSHPGGSTPLDIFKVRVDRDLKNKLDEDTILVEQIIKEAPEFEITENTEYVVLQGLVEKDERAAKINPRNIKLIHESMTQRIRDDKARQAARVRKDFLRLLDDNLDIIKPDTTWDDIKGELQERSAARAVASEDLCAAFLQEFKETDPWRHDGADEDRSRKRKHRHHHSASESEGSDDEHSSKKKKKRKKKSSKRKKRHSDSGSDNDREHE